MNDSRAQNARPGARPTGAGASSGGDPERAALDARVLDWIADWTRSPGDEAAAREARFDALARDLFVFQFDHCEAYGRFCRGRGVTPDRVTGWREIPPVPAGAFKELALRSFPAERTRHVFRTSGTTGARRGELHLDTLALYEASVVPSFVRFVLPEASEALAASATRAQAGAASGESSPPASAGIASRSPAFALRILAPSPVEVPDSSLSHMFGVLLRELGERGIVDRASSGFDLAHGVLDVEGLAAAIGRAREAERPVALCGTAFAFVHLLDAFGANDERWRLPAGSRVMETGGFKGRSRELSRDALHDAIAERLGVARDHVLNQYGMTELASQWHDSTLALPGTPRRKLAPPWMRARLVDPESGRDVADGEVGAIVLVDLANTGSVAAIQTADLGRRFAGGLDLLGRDPGAEARGCSIAADEMLATGVRA